MAADNSVTWADDADVLAQVGRQLFGQPTRVRVRLTRGLAAAALAAWQRDEDERLLPPETPELRTLRHRAGTLALIGLAVETGGVEDGDSVVVEVDSWLVGIALQTAEDVGLLQGLHPPQR